MKAIELDKKLNSKARRTVNDLKQAIATRAGDNPNFCLLLGSGASKTSGIRTAGDLVEYWKNELYKGAFPDKPPTKTEEIDAWLTSEQQDWYERSREYSCLIERIYPLPSPRRIFIEGEVAEKTPSIGYAYLVRLAEAGFLKTIFTTNFDDLLNEAFYQFSSERPIVCAHDSSVYSISITSRRTKIIKLHGDYLFDDLKTTTTDTRDLDKNMEGKLGEFLKEYGLIVGGYSGGDRSIMANLERMASDKNYLQNGLYWCFRPTDEIHPQVLELFHKRDNTFYVLTDGFDELMADLHDRLINTATPFSSRIANNRATKIIDGYLANPILGTTTSLVIKRHLRELESDKRNSLITDALKDIQAEKIASSGMSDSNMLVFLEIEKAMRSRDISAALEIILQEIGKTTEPEFKEALLYRRFTCARMLNRLKDAEDAASQIQQIEPQNYYVALAKCSLFPERAKRLESLREAEKVHPFSAAILNQYAQELHAAINNRDTCAKGKNLEDVVSIYHRSCKVDPSIKNAAWSRLFGLFSDKIYGLSKSTARMTDIVDHHLNQNANSPETSSILYRFCEYESKAEFRGISLFTYLESAYASGFPRKHAEHLDVLTDACIEFNQIALLRKIFEEACKIESLRRNDDFIGLLMTISYEVFRDRKQAIGIGENHLSSHKSTNIERHLFWLYLHEGRTADARSILQGLQGAIDVATQIDLESEILEYEDRFQDAIDLIEATADRRDFEEKYTVRLTYLELRKPNYESAFSRIRTFLEKRSFPSVLGTEIINYEYAKKKIGKKIDPNRLTTLVQSGKSKTVKAVALYLMGEEDQAIQILREEASKKFSWIEGYVKWPVLTDLRPKIDEMRRDLLAASRQFDPGTLIK